MTGFFWLFVALIIFVLFWYYMHGGGDNPR